MLQGKGWVRNDNDSRFFICVRCGHESLEHAVHAPTGQTKNNATGVMGAAGKGSAAPNVPVGTHNYTSGEGGTRGGLKSAYYYASVKSEGQTKAPERISVGEGGVQLSSGAVRSKNKTHGDSSYYYAHDRTVDVALAVAPHKLEGWREEVDPFTRLASKGGGLGEEPPHPIDPITAAAGDCRLEGMGKGGEIAEEPRVALVASCDSEVDGWEDEAEKDTFEENTEEVDDDFFNE